MTTATFLRSPQFAAASASPARRRVSLAMGRPRAGVANVPMLAPVAATKAFATASSFSAKRIGYAIEAVVAGIMIAGYLVLALFG